jgi:HK97 gp10 family phage protein
MAVPRMGQIGISSEKLGGLLGLAGSTGRGGAVTGAGGIRLEYKTVAQRDGMIKLRRFSENPKTNLDKIALRGAKKMMQLTEAAMREDKTGTWWPQHPNRSSAPGEFPAKQSGELIASFRTGVVSSPRNHGKAIFGAGNKLPRSYAFYLEYGTMHMAPRPFMRRAAVQFRKEVQAEMRKEWGDLRRISANKTGRHKNITEIFE